MAEDVLIVQPFFCSCSWIGAERESRGKPVGISTNSLVIGGAMLFTYLSDAVDPNSTSRIAAQIVSRIDFWELE